MEAAAMSPSSRSSPEPAPGSCVSSPRPSRISTIARLKSIHHHHVATSLPLSKSPSLAISNNSSHGSLVSVSSLPPITTPSSASPDLIRSPLAVTPSQISMPLSLPDRVSMSDPTSPYSTMSEAMSIKSPSSLIRRFSKGAHSRIGRRTSTSSDRDRSAGPIIIRRRSDSNKFTQDTSCIDVSDLELEPEDAIDDAELARPRSVRSGTQPRPSMASNFSEVFAPAIPAALSQATKMSKVTKRKRKTVFLQLDYEAGKIYWDPKKSSKQIYIDDIQAVRGASEAREYRDAFQFPVEIESRWFSIIYADGGNKTRSGTKTAHFIAGNEFMRQMWVDTVDRIQRQRIQTMTDIAKGGEKSLKDLWAKEVRDRARVDFAAVKNMCRALNINCSDFALREQFNRADSNHLRTLDFAQFRLFIKRIRKRQDLKQIFNNIKKGGASEMDEEDLFGFLRNVQKIDVDEYLAWWRNLFEKYCRKCRESEASSSREDPPMTMNFAAFQDLFNLPYISGGISTWRSEKLLDRPLNEYFVSSSHNTYLVGRQCIDDSSTEAYVTALSRGCRCVEIDCWDGNHGKPEVRHGHSFTTPVLFADCINVINEYAFTASEYPLILSLEVHCSPEQQTLMVNIMKGAFGDKLVTQPLDAESGVLPSPEQLKGRILIKVKASSEELLEIAQAGLGTFASYGVPMSSPPSFSPVDSDARYHSSSATPLTPASSAEESDEVLQDRKKKKHCSKIIRALGEMGTYAKGIKFRDFRSVESRTFNHIFSLAEGTFHRAISKERGAKTRLEEHNRRYLMRVYPSNFRLLSNNFDPLEYWRRGVQMCALNWQTNDHGMQINDAMFAAGDDRTGYVLKPADMRGETGYVKPSKKLVRFSIDVISAQQLPRPRGWNADVGMNPYIEFEVFTAEDKNVDDGASSIKSGKSSNKGSSDSLKRRTNIVENNGYDPAFHEVFSFAVKTKYPSLVFVRWTVRNSPDGRNYPYSGTPLASYTAKLDSLEEGYRHVPLNNAANERYYFSTLFCKINKEKVFVLEDERDDGVEEDGSRGGILKRVFNRPSSLRRRNNMEREMIPANTFPLSGGGGNAAEILRRVGSADEPLTR